MKITKLVHSCLLVEHDGRKILIDPGEYSFNAGLLKLDSLKDIDYLLITHKHADHMHAPFVKDLLAKNPKILVFSNKSVQSILEKENIKVLTQGNREVKIEEVPHEKIWVAPPAHVKFTLFNMFTDPGDSFSFDKTTEILALPMQAPWGNMTQALNLALKLKPKVIIPVHDWHWRDEARVALHERAKEYFAANGIEFYGGEKGVVYEN